MAFDINAIRITGTVEQFDIITTKTGAPMIRLMLRSFRELFTVVAFKKLAEATRLNAGDRVEVRGRVQSTAWTDKEGNKRYGFQVVATDIEPDMEAGQAPPPEEERFGVMEYQGGPF